VKDTHASENGIIWVSLIFLIATPIAAAILVPWYLLTHAVPTAAITTALILWGITGMGICAGYHRLFAHRCYKANPLLRAFLLIAGAGALENSAIAWCAAHRFHHRHVDTDEDPYNAKRGFWFSHIGWVFRRGAHHGDLSSVPDLLQDPLCRWQDRYYLVIGALFNVGLPVLLGWLTGDVLGMLIFAGLVRVIVVHHFTFTINSLAHMWGRQPWSPSNTSRDNWIISLISFGEGYHNYHHSFQSDYRNGPLWYNYDPGKWFIWSMSRIGLASDLHRAPADVVYRRRFKEKRAALSEHLSRWGERIEEWKARPGSPSLCPRQDLLNHLLNAEAQLKSALAELKAARLRLTSEPLERIGAAWRAQRRAQFRRAKRSAQKTLRHWEMLAQSYIARLDPAPEFGT